MEIGKARLMFGDIKSNLEFFIENKKLYLPSYNERRVDSAYI